MCMKDFILKTHRQYSGNEVTGEDQYFFEHPRKCRMSQWASLFKYRVEEVENPVHEC